MSSHRSLWVCLAALAALYTAVLPFVFFRHDDWWIIGNSVRYLQEGWGYLWRPTLVHDGAEIAWFFRPGFKFLAAAFFGLFGYHYALWVATLVALYLVTLGIGARICERLTGDVRSGLWFCVAIASSVAIHFGSLTWVGEGLMNVPQVFLLMVCTWAFVEGRLTGKAFFQRVSLAAFAAALLFKEAAIFHLAFLGAMLFAEPRLTQLRPGKRLLALLPFIVLGSAYLVLRLGAMPVNPSYLPVYTFAKLVRSLCISSAPLMLPLGVWTLALRWMDKKSLGSFLSGLKTRGWYLPFLAASLSVYVGHGFFSPGWYLTMGTFWLLALAFQKQRFPKPNVVGVFAAVVLLFSAVPVGVRLHALGWFQWHHGQRATLELVTKASSAYRRIQVRNCENPLYPGMLFGRVVAHEEGLRQMWFMTHGQTIDVAFTDCAKPAVPSSDLVLEWKFPNVSLAGK